MAAERTPVKCTCKQGDAFCDAIIQTANNPKDARNAGREFWVCRIGKKEAGGCGFFRWAEQQPWDPVWPKKPLPPQPEGGIKRAAPDGEREASSQPPTKQAKLETIAAGMKMLMTQISALMPRVTEMAENWQKLYDSTQKLEITILALDPQDKAGPVPPLKFMLKPSDAQMGV